MFRGISKFVRLGLAILVLIAMIAQAGIVSYGEIDPYANVTVAEIDAARIQLEAMGNPYINSRGQILNYKTFAIYRVVSYSNCHGDSKIDSNDVIQYRYLGYDFLGNAITNDLFPPDVSSSTALVDKIWVTSPANYGTWQDMVLAREGLKAYMLTTKVLNDGKQINLTLPEILAKRPVSAWTEKLDYMKVMSTPSVEVNGTVQLRQNNGFYDTFTIPSMKNTIKTSVILSTPVNQYQMLPGQASIDIPVTVTAAINYGGLPLSYMSVSGVHYKGYAAPKGNNAEISGSTTPVYTFMIKVYRQDLNSGSNVVNLNGSGDFASIFMSDPNPIVKTGSKTIQVFLGEGTPVIIPEPPAAVKISGEADLLLPPDTYEGHPALAEDASSLSVDGEAYSAARAYAEGLASNSFSVVERGVSTVRKIKSTAAEMTFNNPGTYTGRLEVYPKEGEELSDQETIKVLATPAIKATLTGVQKDNRKQILNISVALHPEYPLTDLYVELEQTENPAGTKIHLTRAAPQQNSAIIKTRPMIEAGVEPAGSGSSGAPAQETKYFAEFSLEFLTKNPGQMTSGIDSLTPASFQYKIYAKDSRGNTDTVIKTFLVAPDLPPVPVIDLKPEYIRNQGENLAEIIVEDATVSVDGDQLARSWISPGLGIVTTEFRDLSFGTKKKVAFTKEGVGPFSINLALKEIWIEPTLEEYVSEADRKTAAATKQSKVINIAPVVSLSPIDSVKADVLILTTGEEDYEILKNEAIYQQEFLRNGIDAEMTLEKVTAPVVKPSVPTSILTVNSPYGYEGRWTFLEQEGYTIDDQRLYVLEATWPGAGSLDYPIMPYKLKAYDIKEAYKAMTSGQGGAAPAAPPAAWTYTINAGTFNITNTSSIILGHDDQDAFLYIIGGGKTLLLDKKTGAFLTVLNFEAGKKNYVSDQYIYAIKGTGLYGISKSNGSIRKIFAAPAGGSISENARRVGDKIHFMTISGNQLSRGMLDTETEKVTLVKLPGTQADPNNSAYNLIGIDAQGKMIIHQTPNISGSCTVTTRIFDEQNKLIKSISKTGEYPSQFKVTPVWDEAGDCTYINYCRTRSSSSYYYFDVDTWGALDSFNSSYSYRSSSKYLSNDNAVYARNVGDKIYLFYGGIWDYIYNAGYLYDERTSAFVVDIPSKSTSIGNVYSYGLDIAEEFGRQADLYAAVQSSANSTSSPLFRTKVMTWNQNLEQIIDRMVTKYLSREDGLKYVVISDQNHELAASGSQLEKWALPDGPYSAGLKNKVARSGATLLFTANPDPAEIRDEIIAGKNGLKNVLSIELPQQTQTNPGDPPAASLVSSMQKTLKLKADTTYYYEYDLKTAEVLATDIFSTEYQVNKVLPDSQFVQGAYRVTQMMEEDFNDPVANPFFRLGSQAKIINGVYRACDSNAGKTTTNRMQVFTDTIRFTVPEGKKAILAMDYDYSMDTQFINGNRIAVNGKPWDICTLGTAEGSGRYYYKEILAAGEVTIDLNITFYGRLPSSYKLIIDNLCVMFVEETPLSSPAVSSLGSNPSVLSDLKNDWHHISGSFATPSRIVSFRPQPIEALFENFNDTSLIPYLRNNSPGGSGYFYISGGEYTHTYGKASEGELVFSIPAGKIGQAKINTWSSIRRSSVTFAMGGATWQNGPMSSEQSTYRYTGSPYSIMPTAITGTKSLTLRNSYQDIAGISDIELSVYEANALSGSGRFFLDKANNRIYLENETFGEEGTVKFVFPQGASYSLQNLKIYSMENGIKTYVADDYFGDASAINSWQAINASLSITKDDLTSEAEQSMIYQKGELVSYNIGYYDYESDPSKKQYWRYSHLPSNDGLHPEAGKILDKPIERFYVDGKYTVEHWQEDNTTRGVNLNGNPDYDKLSNVETITFYIEGSGAAPWITYIKTLPAKVKEGSDYKLEIGVNDTDLQALSLTTEVYNKIGKRIYTHEKINIIPVAGRYPVTLTGEVTNGRTNATGEADTAALSGKYRVVCTVRDSNGAGLGTASYIILSDGKISGAVQHTAQWEDNRQRSNLTRYGAEENLANPSYGLAPRGRLVFWSGEKFVLAAETEGEPTSVKAQILEAPEYLTTLTRQTGSASGSSAASGTLAETWSGELWNENMINKWGRSGAKNLTIRFTASYTSETGTTTKTNDVRIIVYNPEDFWQLHRVW